MKFKLLFILVLIATNLNGQRVSFETVVEGITSNTNELQSFLLDNGFQFIDDGKVRNHELWLYSFDREIPFDEQYGEKMGIRVEIFDTICVPDCELEVAIHFGENDKMNIAFSDLLNQVISFCKYKETYKATDWTGREFYLKSYVYEGLDVEVTVRRREDFNSIYFQKNLPQKKPKEQQQNILEDFKPLKL